MPISQETFFARKFPEIAAIPANASCAENHFDDGPRRGSDSAACLDRISGQTRNDCGWSNADCGMVRLSPVCDLAALREIVLVRDIRGEDTIVNGQRIAYTPRTAMISSGKCGSRNPPPESLGHSGRRVRNRQNRVAELCPSSVQQGCAPCRPVRL